ncbi:MAG: hypothetical protein QOI83_4202, partial [Streptomycetaceae bacterium]|nr:hypothetical protein [Streptomycetaceae bacterium]
AADPETLGASVANSLLKQGARGVIDDIPH